MPTTYTKKKGDRLFPDYNKYLFNIDTLWLNIDSFHYEQVMDYGIRDLLIEGREHLSDTGEHLTIPITLDGYENDIHFEIQGAQPPQYSYSIRNKSMAVYFSKHVREDSSPMKIQINQFVLWEKGVEKAYEEAKDVLRSMGFLPHTAKLNRIDFACHSDQFKWNLTDLQQFKYPKNIADDNKPNFVKLCPTTLDFETVYFGDRERLLLRIYNKSKEIRNNNKDYFNDMYRKQGMDIHNIWNVEFEIRRKFLKDLKKKDGDEFKPYFNDFDKCLAEDGLSRLWSYLMTKYTLQGKNGTSQHWQMISKGDEKKFKEIANFNLKVEKDIDSNFDREIAQIAGRLMTGVLSEEDYSLDNAIEKFKDKLLNLEMNEKRKAWHEIVEKKKAMIHSKIINRTITKTEKDQQKKDTHDE